MSKRIITQKDIIQRQLDLYAIFLTKVPSKKMLELELAREDSGLQDWVCDNLKPEFEYATGIHTIELIEAMVLSQVENGEEEVDVKPKSDQSLKCFVVSAETKGNGYIQVFAKNKKQALKLINEGEGRSIQDDWSVDEWCAKESALEEQDYTQEEYEEYLKETK